MHTARFQVPGAFPRDEVLSSQTTGPLPTEFSLEWNAISREHCNVLVEAMPAVAGQILEKLRPHLRTPIEEYRPKVGIPVPQPSEGTLILSGVESLDAGQQAQLLKWLDQGKKRVQLASISSEPLFPLVEAGTFDAALYYRLNIVRIEYRETPSIPYREHGLHIRREHARQPVRPFVKGTSRQRLVGENHVVVRRVNDTPRGSSSRQVHQVQAVELLQPQVRHQQVGGPGGDPRARHPKLRAGFHLGERLDGFLGLKKRPGIWIDDQDVPKAAGHPGRHRHGVAIVGLDPVGVHPAGRRAGETPVFLPNRDNRFPVLLIARSHASSLVSQRGRPGGGIRRETLVG
jgi:hypothetical protein